MNVQDEIFKPRDFIYINKQKLDSYFSQLYGGLIGNMDLNNLQGEEGSLTGKLSGEGLAKFGLGNGSSSIASFLLSHLGKLEASLKGNIEGQVGKHTQESSSVTTTRTLEHFQYTLFEESLTKLGYLIDLDKYVAKNPKIEAGIIKQNFSSSDFIKFRASSIEMSDYRNSSDFVRLIKRIIDLVAEVKSGEILDQYTGRIGEMFSDQAKEAVRTQSLAMIAGLFNQGANTTSFAQGKMVEVIVKAVDEVFSGNLIPLDVLLNARLSLNKMGTLTFESLLKDEFLLENRTDLAFKYGYFEDAGWTIIGQITSLKAPSPKSIKDVFESFGENIKEQFSDPSNVDVNLLVKTVIREIDLLSKNIGLLPQLSEHHIALTPVAIYREPQPNSFFK